ncbi:MAG: T9SS type A sorting domain-containing protein [Bacteroidetes bacterium]|nr:T9SS type A sorting domain-containing protein [Bacteroidota bacterium]
MDYIFDQTYEDKCHPNNPNCISGVTCPDCNDGFNPHLIVASSMIHYSNSPFDSTTTRVENLVRQNEMRVYPNPSSGIVEVALTRPVKRADLVVLNTLGEELKRMKEVDFRNQKVSLDLSYLPSGMYLIVLEGEGKRSSRVLYLVR